MQAEDYNKEAEVLRFQYLIQALERIEKTGEKTALEVEYTNGKVKKLIISMVALSAFSVGLGVVEAGRVLAIFL